MKKILIPLAGLAAVAVFVSIAAFGVLTGSGQALQAQAAAGGVCQTGGNQGGDSALAAPGPQAKGVLSYLQVAKAAYAAGFRGRDVVIAVAVAQAESGHDPRAVNQNTNGTQDLGLFQINTIHGAILKSGDPFSAADNARMAFQVFTDAGSRWGPWVTYWSGSYRKFMDEAQAAVEGVDTGAQKPSAPSLTGLFDQVGCSGQQVVDGAQLADPGSGPQGSDGLTPRAEAVKAATLQRWGCAKTAAPCVSTVGGYAPRNIAGTGTPSDHASGNADDIMLPADYSSSAARALGDTMADFWVQHASQAGVHYVIFNHRIWSAEKAAQGWRPYQHPSGLHSPTLDHENHVHVSVLH